MSSTQPIQLGCELVSLEEPISGLIRNGQGRTVEFRGWIEFAAVLIDLAEDASRSQSIPPNQGVTDES